MKKLVTIMLTICMCLSICAMFTACGNVPPATVTYTVTEDEWKTNFNLTNSSTQAQTLGSASAGILLAGTTPVTQISSYTVYAEGVNAGTPGTALLKVAPNAMSIDFYVNGSRKESECGIFENTNVLYTSVTTNMKMFLPFANNYGDFTYDATKKAYVGQNITSIIVDDYDPTETSELYTKTAEAKFENGYIKTVSVEICDNTFTDVMATFTFTFSNVNNTTVTVA